jgi:hypothetical protein
MWPRFYDSPLVLSPRHAAVFRRSAAILADDVNSEYWTTIAEDEERSVFERLTIGQKQVAILAVAKALLLPEVELPLVTAVLAATVDMIYHWLLTSIELEMSYDDEDTTVRAMVLEALDEMNYWESANSANLPGEEPLLRPAPESKDNEEWSFLVDALREEILEDFDFEMEKTFLDTPPEFSADLKRQMNIHPDYFVATVEDPTPARLEEIRRELRALLE